MSETSVTYTIASSDKGESLVVVGTTVRAITSANPRYRDVKNYLESNQGTADFNYVLSLIDAGPEAIKKLVKLSERVTYENGHLFFDNDEIENALSKHIVDMIKAGDEEYGAFVLFLENLSTNPSKKSRKALFEWVNDRDLTITEEGEFVAYKGVTRDGKSIHAGGAYVDTGDGPVWVNGQIPNEIGAVISMPRTAVDSDRENYCSSGLHAGTSAYARSFGHKTLVVAINPRDVVMVPPDHSSAKLRVCRYRVLDNNEVDLDETTYGGKHRYNAAAEAAESFTCEDCEEPTPVNQRSSEDGSLCSDCAYYRNSYCEECSYSTDVCECF